ncbi:MAG: hypothetical protein M3011_10565 [Actinomycetota bacterium]|nr:hypothetical protein [Actinomycetota bacterium]
MATTSHYLTVRCLGCEAWLHPMAVKSHATPGKCRGHQWVDDVVDSALVTAPLGLILAEALPAGLVSRPTLSDDRVLNPGPGEYLRPEVCRGVVVSSPLAGVGARRWALVAKVAAERDGIAGVRSAMVAERFAELETELVGSVVDCPSCGQVVASGGLRQHRVSNILCRWRRCVAEVQELWALGWRDPYNVAGAPLSWTELQRTVAWRRRLRTVAFPRWAAVLVVPGADASSRGVGAPGVS